MKIKLNTNICPIIIPDTYGSGIQYQNIVDWDRLKELMIDKAKVYIEDALQEIDMPYENLKMGEFGSPQFYNFTTDWIEFELEIPDDYISYIRETVREYEAKEFFEFVGEKFGSHDGFISFYPYEMRNFYNAKDKDEYILSMWIIYQMEEQEMVKEYQNDYLDEVIEYADCNGYFEYEEDE